MNTQDMTPMERRVHEREQKAALEQTEQHRAPHPGSPSNAVYDYPKAIEDGNLPTTGPLPEEYRKSEDGFVYNQDTNQYEMAQYPKAGKLKFFGSPEEGMRMTPQSDEQVAWGPQTGLYSARTFGQMLLEGYNDIVRPVLNTSIRGDSAPPPLFQSRQGELRTWRDVERVMNDGIDSGVDVTNETAVERHVAKNAESIGEPDPFQLKPVELPEVEPPDLAGQVVGDVVSFLSAFMPNRMLVKALTVNPDKFSRWVKYMANVAQNAAASGMTEYQYVAATNTHDNVSSMLQDMGVEFEGPLQDVVDFLATDESMSDFDKALRNWIEGGFIGATLTGGFAVAVKGVPFMGKVATEAAQGFQQGRQLGRLGPVSMAGGPVSVPDTPDTRFFRDVYTPDTETLTEEGLALQEKFAQELLSDIDGALERYAQLPQTKGGKIIAADDMRELSPEYVADRSRSNDVHEPVSALSKIAWKRAMETPGDAPVMLLSGGTGAGKTTGLKKVSVEDYGAILDSNLQNFDKAVAKIEEALANGKPVHVMHVYRDPVEAFSGVGGSALTRAMKNDGNGRTVPLWAHLNTHIGSNTTVKRLEQKYAGDDRVQIIVFDNSRGKGLGQEADTSIIPDEWNEKELEEILYEELDKALEEGRINEKVYRGTRGKD